MTSPLPRLRRSLLVGVALALASLPVAGLCAEGDKPAQEPAAEASPATPPAQKSSVKGVVDTALKPVKAVATAAWEPVKSAGGALSKSTVAVGQYLRDEILRVRDFFDVTLPGIAEKHHLILDFEPKVGDLVRREYIRYPLDLRYGLSNHWEAYAGITPYSPNPFDAGQDHRWGPGYGKLGVRYDLPLKRLWYRKITVGLEGQQPFGNPPIDLNDHYAHVRPSITASRPFPGLPDTTLFTNLLYDRAVWAPGHDDVSPEVMKRHMSELGNGLLYKPGEFGYFGQYALRHWDEPVGYRLEHIAKVGVIWDMPLERSRKWFRIDGKWQFELGLKVSDLEGESPNYGVHARVKWKTDFFRKLGRKLK